MNWETKVEPSKGEQDWCLVRECFVRAFHSYPLYKYLVPDETKRPEFLRQYLEAVYDVTVKNGNSILLCIKLKEKREFGINCEEKPIVIGGVLFVPPSQNGGGWQCERDEDFWDAYQKYNLKNIDEESFNRLERYEEWEYENISKYVCASDLPMWNGIFCAIDPKYAGKGCGSVSYSDCLKLMTTKPSTSSKSTKQKNNIPKPFKWAVQKLNHVVGSIIRDESIKTNDAPPQKPPTLFVLSHSRSAVRFHKKNGLQEVTSFSYDGSDSSTKAFEVSVLLLNRLDQSKAEKLKEVFMNEMTSTARNHEIVAK